MEFTFGKLQEIATLALSFSERYFSESLRFLRSDIVWCVNEI